MIKPKQRLPFSQKNPKWIEENARYVVDTAIEAIDPTYADMLYRAANGELVESDYTHILNPYSTKQEKYKKFPAKLRNYDIISSYLMLFLGEKRSRGINANVIARNSNIQSVKKERETQEVNQMLSQMFMNEFIQQEQANGGQVDLEQVQAKSVEEIKKTVEDIQDEVAIQGQIALDYIIDYNDIESRFNSSFYHWLVTARTFSYRDLSGDEVIYRDISPKHMKYIAHSTTRMMEDAEATVYSIRMPVNDVLDKFQGVDGFTKEIENQLQALIGYTASERATEIPNQSEFPPEKSAAFTELWNNLFRQSVRNMYSDELGILVEHIVWDSEVKIGNLTITNAFGQSFDIEVDEDYVPLPGEEIEWRWVKQKWECYLIDDRFVVGGRPLLHHQGSWGEPDKVRGPYNGRIMNIQHVNPKSIVEKGIPFQIKHNILHYLAEKIIAKNMDQMVVLPVGLIPEKYGLDMDAAMYYANATNFLFVDESNPKFQVAAQALKVMNSSAGNYLQSIYELMQFNIAEWENQIGINPQRKGQTSNREGKAVNESAVFRSSLMTEELFSQHEELEERDLNCLMNLSAFAFSEGKKASFLNRDKKQMLLDVSSDYPFWDYLVRVSNSGREAEKYNQAKQLAQALAQNSNGKFTPAFKVLQSNNISEIVENMEQLELEIQQQIEQQQEAERQKEIAIENEKTRQEELKTQQIQYKVDREYDKAIEVAKINADAKLQMDLYNPDGNGQAEASAVLEAAAKREEISNRHSIEQQKLAIDREKSVRDSETKKYVADKQLAVARENKGQ